MRISFTDAGGDRVEDFFQWKKTVDKSEGNLLSPRTRSALCLCLDFLLQNTGEVVHIIPFLLYGILQRVDVLANVLHFVRVMFYGLWTRLFHVVSSPNVDYNVFRIRELAWDIQRICQWNQDTFIFVIRLDLLNVLETGLEFCLRLLQLREGIGQMIEFIF